MKHAPAAERNKAPILDVLIQELPEHGQVLEIASGTGQHVAHFAAALPALSWQPSDPDASTLESIEAHVQAARVNNVSNPVVLDAREARWPVEHADAIVCINMIHIAPWSAAAGLMRGAAALLDTGAPLVLYGPYKRGGEHTASSNADFDASLKMRDPEWGVRDLDDVAELARQHGFELERVVEMPANNLTVVFRQV